MADRASRDLWIDTDRAIAAICEDLRARVTVDGKSGVILGLSGGLDSSVLATIAVRALGSERCKVVYISDRVSEDALAGHARLMADWLHLKLERQDISGEMERRGIYRPLFLRLLELSPSVAGIASRSYVALCGETPFRSTLRVGRGERLHPFFKRLIFNLTMRHLDAGFTARHVFRRRILERLARARNLLMIGAANRSETEVGWFVKGGIDDLEVQPLMRLWKTQVRQIAQALELPAPILNQLPSPDMARGVTDEFGIGHDYADVDIILDARDQGYTPEEIATLGYTVADIADIVALAALSDWKRAGMHAPAPVDGGVGSDLRRDSSTLRHPVPA